MASGKKLIDQLCSVVSSFLCPSISSLDIDRCAVGPHIFSRGSSQAICTVKLLHGEVYNLEFVYRYWAHILEKYNFPFSPTFIICNNGLAVTLKCYVSEPRDLSSRYGQATSMALDVNLQRNSFVVLSQDDFIKFKTPLVFAKDLDITNSMVVCRTYLTSSRNSLQFLVVKSKNPRRLENVLDMIKRAVEATGSNLPATREKPLPLEQTEQLESTLPSSGHLRVLQSTSLTGRCPSWGAACALLLLSLAVGLMAILAAKLMQWP
ncbi:tegument protein [Alcelaphine gammaherpesvirus 1]|uniref:Nuclear egress protein 2 n=1 Tax=Alcelaphine herpesvirus 1 (strain C500) TaxID=654901 RepID=NEC2_ALHV1|nr:tegument protein [Alcelaphine gammaherpesvirus 1]O36417.1 RecName: Full=Nuclear egress protein 2 [Alcelaphine herpesvirus 1 strain C500]AAC58114.1 tegument protein [Alcelaphine gammaherpesvirus 1]APB09490.1 nuclear egress membrane protein [Alcelaphine gammaherpesvirus 1]APB09562.1 nuclear egress membrane protein [Alcelaphine gammaherpesvirus 1]ATI21953.1 ORF67 [Alcelaphine gammaherpesvirus 1]QDY92301.1 nuclear egress membrane protein [Alcelaphine gammaherpesvirus 1]